MSKLNITELRQQRAKIVEEMRKLQDGIDERGSETAEEGAKFAAMEKDCRALEVRIEREEKLQEEEAKMAASLDKTRKDPDSGTGRWAGIQYPTMTNSKVVTRAEHDTRVSYALQGWLRARQPDAKIDPEHEEAARLLSINLRDKEIELPIIKTYRQFQREFRAGLNVADSTAGKETIPQGFVNALEESLLAHGGMRAVSEVIRTDSGNDLPWPTVNDVTNKGVILAEATTIGSTVDPVFGSVTFKAFKYSSKAILISSELLQDSAFDLGARLGEMLGIRIARIQNDHFTTGGGTTLPKGAVVSSSLGKLAIADTAFTADEVIDLEHSVDPAYRMGARFMMHDLVLASVRKLKESTTNAYIWQPGLQAGVPDRLLGYPYTVNQSMSSTFEADEIVMMFGDFSKYKIRDVASIRLVRLDELYAGTDQVAFIAFLRSDGQLLDAGTDPIKHLQLAPS